MPTPVRPKKKLGQHFLVEESYADRIVAALPAGVGQVLEIGPGMGVLTERLIERPELDLKAIELDDESVAYLQARWPERDLVIEGDALKMDWLALRGESFALIGNYPYNISSPLFFRMLELREHISVCVCMVQKEVADRIAAPPGSKTYGLLSPLCQAYFEVENLLSVPPSAFLPPPKVQSAVLRFTRKETAPDIDFDLFKRVVKTAFGQRRKTLRNALKPLTSAAPAGTEVFLDRRAEQLSWQEFVQLAGLYRPLLS